MSAQEDQNHSFLLQSLLKLFTVLKKLKSPQKLLANSKKTVCKPHKGKQPANTLPLLRAGESQTVCIHSHPTLGDATIHLSDHSATSSAKAKQPEGGHCKATSLKQNSRPSGPRGRRTRTSLLAPPCCFNTCSQQQYVYRDRCDSRCAQPPAA